MCYIAVKKKTNHDDIGPFGFVINSFYLALKAFMHAYMNTGFERVSLFKKLKTLKLKDNKINESLITSLSDLPLLKTLDLSNNLLSGSFPAQGTFFDLSYDMFSLFQVNIINRLHVRSF